MTTTTPDPKTLARRTDPETSHEAARKPRKVDLIRAGILAVLADGEPRTLDQIIDQYAGRHGYPTAGPSSIRTRVAELRKDQKVERVPGARAESNLGNPAGLYRAVAVQQNETPGENK